MLKMLDVLLDDIVNKLQVDNESENQAQEFMREGPRLERQFSRLTVTHTRITVESEN